MPTKPSPLLKSALEQVAIELSAQLRGVFSPETVTRYVWLAYEQIGDRPTVGSNFPPISVSRFAHEQLWAVAQAGGQIPKEVPEILFVCERNAGRSQMAAALAQRISQGWGGVRSAGAHPEEAIEPTVVEAMAELGVDLSTQFPKPLTDAVVEAADVVVTMGCGDACPVFPGHRYLDWPVPDPAGQTLDAVRLIRHDLYHRVWDLVQTLIPHSDLMEPHLNHQGEI